MNKCAYEKMMADLAARLAATTFLIAALAVALYFHAL